MLYVHILYVQLSSFTGSCSAIHPWFPPGFALHLLQDPLNALIGDLFDFPQHHLFGVAIALPGVAMKGGFPGQQLNEDDLFFALAMAGLDFWRRSFQGFTWIHTAIPWSSDISSTIGFSGPLGPSLPREFHRTVQTTMFWLLGFVEYCWSLLGLKTTV